MKTDLTVAGYIFHEDKLLLIHHGKLDLWLPIGGHIEQDEVPDDALTREIKEETNLDVEIYHDPKIPTEGNELDNLRRATKIPFHTNVHSVGDHNHYCMFYVCKALNPEALKINEEIKNSMWITKQELFDKSISPGIRNIALEAFKLYEEIK